MKQPDGFINEDQTNQVCRFKKCIYGLKQAPRADKFNCFLFKFGLTQSEADPCILFRHQQGEVAIVASMSTIVMNNKKHFLKGMTEYLGTNFQIRCFPANPSIGLDISDRGKRQKPTEDIFDQHLLTKMLERFNFNKCN